MMNIQGLMKQAQMMQKKLQEEQNKLDEEEVEGISGGGMVKLTLNGKYTMKKISLDKSIVDPEETEVLEDLITAAYNDAKEKIDAKKEEALGSIAGGLNLGGLKLPF